LWSNEIYELRRTIIMLLTPRYAGGVHIVVAVSLRGGTVSLRGTVSLSGVVSYRGDVRSNPGDVRSNPVTWSGHPILLRGVVTLHFLVNRY
jgi:hypothetical protein